MLIAVHNPSGQPQVVTLEGRLVGAGEFAAVERDVRTEQLLEQDVLTEVKGEPNDDMDPGAATALQAVVDGKAAAAKARAAKKSTATSEES